MLSIFFIILYLFVGCKSKKNKSMESFIKGCTVICRIREFLNFTEKCLLFVENYAQRDIFNADETVLFFKVLSN